MDIEDFDFDPRKSKPLESSGIINYDFQHFDALKIVISMLRAIIQNMQTSSHPLLDGHHRLAK